MHFWIGSASVEISSKYLRVYCFYQNIKIQLILLKSSYISKDMHLCRETMALSASARCMGLRKPCNSLAHYYFS